jgi:hypothetical protein
MAGNRGGPRPGAGRKVGTRSSLPAAFLLHIREDCEAARVRLREVIDDRNTPLDILLHACELLFNRGYGKPKEHVAFDTYESVRVTYPSLEDMREKLISRGIPIAHLLPSNNVVTIDSLNSPGLDNDTSTNDAPPE